MNANNEDFAKSKSTTKYSIFQIYIQIILGQIFLKSIFQWLLVNYFQLDNLYHHVCKKFYETFEFNGKHEFYQKLDCINCRKIQWYYDPTSFDPLQNRSTYRVAICSENLPPLRKICKICSEYYKGHHIETK